MNEKNSPATDRPVLNVNTKRIALANSANVVAAIGSRSGHIIGSSFPISGNPSSVLSGSGRNDGK